ncbi:MAG: hypothetical protein J6D31_07865 [Clostridia bacterium]|nr:hypothetical protein [Clostridia bacterium]
MLKKLFAYDFRRLGRLTVPCMIGIAVSTLLSLLFFWIGDLAGTGNRPVLLSILGILGLYACIMGLSLLTSAPMLIGYFHFAKNLFFDEGYLTMTLPASEHHILLSKLLSSLLWQILSFIVAFVSLMGLVLGILFISGVPMDTPSTSPEIVAPAGEVIATLLSLLLLALVSVCFEILLGMVVITLGCLMMPKHKILGILLFYFISNWVVGIGSMLLMVVLFGATAAIPINAIPPYAVLLVLTGIIAALSTLCYFFTHRMLKKSINLE